MNILTVLSDRAPNRVFFSILLGAIGGGLYAMLLPLVTLALQPPAADLLLEQRIPYTLFGLEIASPMQAAMFAATCIGIVACRTGAQLLLARLALEVTSSLRKEIYRRILHTPLPNLEHIGRARLITMLSYDVPAIVRGGQLLPQVITNAVILMGMLGYLHYLDSAVFWLILKCIAVGALAFSIPNMFARRILAKANDARDLLQGSVDGLVAGVKELKLNATRQQGFFSHELSLHESVVVRAQKRGITVIEIASNVGEVISFLVVGWVSFVFINYHSLESGELLGVVMALLYLTGPVAVLLDTIPHLLAAQVAMNRASLLTTQLSEEAAGTDCASAQEWQVMALKAACYRHRSEIEAAGYEVGPIDLLIRKGELTFIVGGNGSGKSTLTKILALHYPLASGTICFDDRPVSPEMLPTHRQGISAIHSDYHVFTKLYDWKISEKEIQEYLKLFELDHKLAFNNGQFSTIALSDGQRRRLALVCALAEDRQLYLFDEWAADQDPGFREQFYVRILPALREKGKAVVVITHDDRYFHLADQLVVMDSGRIRETRRMEIMA